MCYTNLRRPARSPGSCWWLAGRHQDTVKPCAPCRAHVRLYPLTHAPSTQAHTHTHPHTPHFFSHDARAPSTERRQLCSLAGGHQEAGVGEVQLLLLMSPERIRQFSRICDLALTKTLPCRSPSNFLELLRQPRPSFLVSSLLPLDPGCLRQDHQCCAVRYSGYTLARHLAPSHFPASASSWVIWGGASSLLQQLNRSRTPACAPPNTTHSWLRLADAIWGVWV